MHHANLPSVLGITIERERIGMVIRALEEGLPVDVGIEALETFATVDGEQIREALASHLRLRLADLDDELIAAGVIEPVDVTFDGSVREILDSMTEEAA